MLITPLPSVTIFLTPRLLTQLTSVSESNLWHYSKVSKDHFSSSEDYGFVEFDGEESAQNAIDELNGTFINDKQVFVEHFL